MKVVMVGPYPHPGHNVIGGVERVIDSLLEPLSQQLELTLVVPGAERDMEASSHGVRTIYLKRGRGLGALNYWRDDARRVARVVESLSPDLVHLQGVAGYARYFTYPSILTIHGIAHRDIVSRARLGSVARQAAAQVVRYIEKRGRLGVGNLIVINPYVLQELPDCRSLHRFDIPNPISEPFLADQPASPAARPRQLISVGRIGPLKNTLRILEIAVERMERDAELKMVLCGTSENDAYFAECRRFILQRGLSERVQWAGSLNTNDLIVSLDNSSCLLVASRQENAPMAIAEAHARGVAVIAPKSFGIPYMIDEARNGFFLPEGDLDAQATAVGRALEHPWDRHAIAAVAQRRYNVTTIAAQTVAAYQYVLKGTSVPNPTNLAQPRTLGREIA